MKSSVKHVFTCEANLWDSELFSLETDAHCYQVKNISFMSSGLGTLYPYYTYCSDSRISIHLHFRDNAEIGQVRENVDGCHHRHCDPYRAGQIPEITKRVMSVQ